MNSFEQLSEYGFEQSLLPENLRPMQIVHGALMAGATMLALIILFLFFQIPSSTSGDPELINILSGVHVLFALGAFGLSRMLFERMFKERPLTTSIEQTKSLYDEPLSMIRVALIVRMAMLEGASLFGLSVCIIAVTGGTAHREPLYLLNMASYALFMIIGYMTFPTKNAVVDIFRKYILKRF